MLISHKYKFIFIHIQKTAGSSISSALNPFCEESYDSIQHWSAVRLKEKFGDDIWNEYFKFSFVRNPYDRLFSWYNMIDKLRHSLNPNPFHSYIHQHIHSFADFIMMDGKGIAGIDLTGPELPPQRITQFQRVSDKNRVIVDFIGRYESLTNDFDYICKRLNISDPLLPHLNKFEHGHYMNYYTNAMIAEVNLFARDDFIHFYDNQEAI